VNVPGKENLGALQSNEERVIHKGWKAFEGKENLVGIKKEGGPKKGLFSHFGQN